MKKQKKNTLINLIQKNSFTRVKTNLKDKKGITLIALVVTIVVLLILAGVTITFVLGEGGILDMAKQAVVAQDNAQIADALQLEASNCFMENIINNTSVSLIDYLKTKQIIDENNVINVKNLLGIELSTGKGTSGSKKDTYVLEENGKVAANTTRLASIKMVKLAEESTNVIIYDIVYYNKSGDSKVIGNINDTGVTESEKIITFTVEGKQYQTKKGTTWYEFYQEVNSGGQFRCYEPEGGVEYFGSDGGVGHVLDKDHNLVKASDVIQEGYDYAYEGNVECVKGDSLILTTLKDTSDLARNISKGSSIVYYNFETNTLEEGIVSEAYIHKNATNFVKYTFDDGSYLEATDYHPIYTQKGWKSLTNRNGYATPEVGDKVKTQNGWKTLTNIEEYEGLEDCYDFAIVSKDGQEVNNYFANGTLVQGSY